jgi:hypothetical protein
MTRHVKPGLLGQGEIERKGNKLNDVKKWKVEGRCIIRVPTPTRPLT